MRITITCHDRDGDNLAELNNTELMRWLLVQVGTWAEDHEPSDLDGFGIRDPNGNTVATVRIEEDIAA